MSDLIKDRPIVFFDLETTGVNLQTDRIVEISVLKVMPDGTRDVRTRRLNPEMPIPPESSAVHGIYDADVANEPTFRRVSKDLFNFLEGCDLGGYNILKFDIPMLKREFSRAGLDFTTEGRRIVDSFNLYTLMEPRNLSGAYRYFCGKDLKNAHSAAADTLASFEIFESEVEKYSKYTADLLPEGMDKFPETLDELHRFCLSNQTAIDPEGRFRWKNNEAVIAFGKKAGTPLRTLAADDPGFLRWIINADFSPETKKIASDALKGVFPVKEN